MVPVATFEARETTKFGRQRAGGWLDITLNCTARMPKNSPVHRGKRWLREIAIDFETGRWELMARVAHPDCSFSVSPTTPAIQGRAQGCHIAGRNPAGARGPVNLPADKCITTSASNPEIGTSKLGTRLRCMGAPRGKNRDWPPKTPGPWAQNPKESNHPSV